MPWSKDFNWKYYECVDFFLFARPRDCHSTKKWWRLFSMWWSNTYYFRKRRPHHCALCWWKPKWITQSDCRNYKWTWQCRWFNATPRTRNRYFNWANRWWTWFLYISSALNGWQINGARYCRNSHNISGYETTISWTRIKRRWVRAHSRNSWT